VNTDRKIVTNKVVSLYSKQKEGCEKMLEQFRAELAPYRDKLIEMGKSL